MVVLRGVIDGQLVGVVYVFVQVVRIPSVVDVWVTTKGVLLVFAVMVVDVEVDGRLVFAVAVMGSTEGFLAEVAGLDVEMVLEGPLVV
jgi:hypothetical protein